MDFNSDHFSLFGLPRRFRLDMNDLDAAWRAVQGVIHPDRFAGASGSEQRLSMQWAARVNEAYQTLKSPLTRASYLLQLFGEKIGTEDNTAMPPDLLLTQVERREKLASLVSGKNAAGIAQFKDQLNDELQTEYAQLAVLLDDNTDFSAAAALLRRVMFTDKLRLEATEAQATVEDQEFQSQS